jgi:hypothetical protein
MLDDTRETRITPPEPTKRSSWYLLTGIILGLIMGLVYAWLINPVVYESSTPGTLSEADKDFYRVMIAQVYDVTGDIARASLRLALLEDPDPVYALGAQAQRALAAGREAEAHALALLASSLQEPAIQQEINPQPLPTQHNPTDPPPGIPTHTLPVPTATP